MGFVAIALLALGSAAAPAVDDCTADPGNLLARANCGFDTDTQGWDAVAPARAVHETQDGAPRPGALRGISDPGGSLTIIGPCVKVAAGKEHRIAAQVRAASGTVFFCAVNAFQYGDESCGEGQEPLGSAAAPPRPTWAPVAGAATTSSTARSARLHAVCSGEPGFEALFDSFVLGPR